MATTVVRYMLDTNAVSYIMKGNTHMAQRLASLPLSAVCISAVTEGELRYGLAKRPTFTRLRIAVEELLRRVDVLPWDSTVAASYGELRANLETQGRVLQSLDMMIAAHALSTDTVLISSDRAFGLVVGLKLEDWISDGE